MPFNRAKSAAESLRAAAMLAMVSPFRARTLVRLGVDAAAVAVVLARRQLVRRTLLLGTTTRVAVFKSTPGFIDWSVATLTPVRLATDCNSSPGAIAITWAESRRSAGTRFKTESSWFFLPAGTRTL